MNTEIYPFSAWDTFISHYLWFILKFSSLPSFETFFIMWKTQVFGVETRGNTNVYVYCLLYWIQHCMSLYVCLLVALYY